MNVNARYREVSLDRRRAETRDDIKKKQKAAQSRGETGPEIALLRVNGRVVFISPHTRGYSRSSSPSFSLYSQARGSFVRRIHPLLREGARYFSDCRTRIKEHRGGKVRARNRLCTHFLQSRALAHLYVLLSFVSDTALAILYIFAGIERGKERGKRREREREGEKARIEKKQNDIVPCLFLFPPSPHPPSPLLVSSFFLLLFYPPASRENSWEWHVLAYIRIFHVRYTEARAQSSGVVSFFGSYPGKLFS